MADYIACFRTNRFRVRNATSFRIWIERQQLTVEKHGRALRFRAEDGTLCRLPRARERAFEVIDPRAVL